jgi:hypothetical protein
MLYWLAIGPVLSTMLYLKCTKKLLEFVHAAPAPLPSEVNDTLLGDWHANVTDLGRRHFLVFLNDKTLYCLVAAIPHSARKVDLGLVFRQLLVRALLRNGIDQARMEQIAREYGKGIITRTDSRKVLGNLNDIMNQMDAFVEEAIEKNKPLDFCEMEDALNRIPQRNIGWKTSVEVFREMLGAR